MIENADKAERAANGNTQIIGIFIGWPGLTMNAPGFRNTTYLTRATIADRISQSSILGKLIGTIGSITINRKAKGHKDVFIIMGYSLGTRILFNATSGLVLYESAEVYIGNSKESYTVIDGPGDLILLINPALSAGNYTAIDSLRRANENFSPDQEPIYLLVSTSNDKVNQVAFPLAAMAKLDWSLLRRTAVGEYPPYVTHRLENIERPLPNSAEHDTAWYDSFCAGPTCLYRLPTDDTKSSDDNELKRPRQPGNPFILAKTTPKIINGHGGFWSSEYFSNWLGAFMAKRLETARADKETAQAQ